MLYDTSTAELPLATRADARSGNTSQWEYDAGTGPSSARGAR
ncbi:hypothetical protein ACF073_11500 [Streptomyces sp. NPDC015171]